MLWKLLAGAALIAEIVAAQQARSAPHEMRSAPNGAGMVTVNPAQPYRPIPAGQAQPRETIFEFYLRALNPRQVRWGEVIDRRLRTLAEQSVGNPYFRFCAVETALIVFLLLICWLWWDKMRQIKWVAAECLADAINAKRIADWKALEAIDRHNRHIEMCNRAIESHESGLPTGGGADDWRREVSDLQSKLAAERAKSAGQEIELRRRDSLQSQMESRIRDLESLMEERQNGANAELMARLQRAETELAGRKVARK